MVNTFKTLVLVATLLVGACTPQNQVYQHVQKYYVELAKLAQEDVSLTTLSSTLTYPDLHSLQYDIPETTINMRAFFGLSECGLQTLVAQRNTALGKIQLPSSRYIYEVKLLQQLRRCRDMTVDENLKNQLTAFYQIKSDSLPKVWANMLQTSEEVKQTLSDNSAYYAQQDAASLQRSVTVFVELMALFETPISEGEYVESRLNWLRQHRVIGHFWRSQLVLTSALEQSAPWLRTQVEKSDCQNSNTLDTLSALYQTHFSAHILPLAETLFEAHSHLQALYQSSDKHPILQQSFKDFLTEHQGIHTRLVKATVQHKRIWQAFADRCK